MKNTRRSIGILMLMMFACTVAASAAGIGQTRTPVAATSLAPAPLAWRFEETGKAPEIAMPIIYDQALSSVNLNAYVDQNFGDLPGASSYIFDDFTNSAPWTIQGLFIPGQGWNGFSTLMNASQLTWAVYADAGGVPAGYPGGGSAPAWSLSLVPSDPQVFLTTGRGGFVSDSYLTLATPFTLPAGHWWLVFYPTLNFTGGGQFGREPADTTNGLVGQIINPGNYFGWGTGFNPWTSALGLSQRDVAFTLYGHFAYNASFMDDLGRSQLCVDTVSGFYTWNLLSGPGSPAQFTGVGKVLNGGAKIVSAPGATDVLNFTIDKMKKKANGYFITGTGNYSPLTDKNTADDPPGCITPGP
jgi:hypothetical protein